MLNATQPFVRRVKRQLGITMIEIVVILTVLGLVIFTMLPDVVVTMGNTKVRAASESLLSGLQRARTEALRRNERMTFFLIAAGSGATFDASCTMSSAGLSWVVSIMDPSGSCHMDIADDQDPRIKQKSDGTVLAENVYVQAHDRTGASPALSVTFDAAGRIAGPNTDIRYIDITHASGNADMRQLRIEMTTGGVIRACEPQIASTSTDPRRCMYPPV